MNKLLLLSVFFAAGCAAPMTAERGLEILRAEYDPQLSSGPDRDKLSEVRKFFLENPGEAGSKLLPLFEDENRLIRIFAIETCAEAMPGDVDLIVALRKILRSDNKSKSLKLAAAEALAAQGKEDAAQELILFLDDDRASRRVRAMMALARPGWKYGAKEISGLLNDREAVSIWMPVKKHFMWFFRWESRGLVQITVREIALACLSRMAEQDFGWQVGDEDLQKLDEACKKAKAWAERQTK